LGTGAIHAPYDMAALAALYSMPAIYSCIIGNQFFIDNVTHWPGFARYTVAM
jgi:hypothetical protein